MGSGEGIEIVSECRLKLLTVLVFSVLRDVGEYAWLWLSRRRSAKAEEGVRLEEGRALAKNSDIGSGRHDLICCPEIVA